MVACESRRSALRQSSGRNGHRVQLECSRGRSKWAAGREGAEADCDACSSRKAAASLKNCLPAGDRNTVHKCGRRAHARTSSRRQRHGCGTVDSEEARYTEVLSTRRCSPLLLRPALQAAAQRDTRRARKPSSRARPASRGRRVMVQWLFRRRERI